MKAIARLSRRFLPVLGLLAGAAGLAALSGAPARAQFFFPFFDNRPTTRPDVGYRHRVHREGVERAHRRKTRAADDKAKAPDAAKAAAAAAASPAPVVEGPPPPYEPQLLRLSEIMGALSYLQPLCGASGAAAATWRAEMEDLMNAENAGPSRREKLAGAFNRGLRGYEYSYRVCTPTARLVGARFLDEGARIAHDVSARYRPN
jgi:uncharacterized protein (TIGR02301 family)